MADTVTTTLGLTKPEVGASEDSWGEKINTNFDLVDDALDGTTAVSLDINGGTIDGAVIGGATPAAGTFTTLTANTSLGGTLSTAAQPNVTSVGTLTGLTVSGSTSLAGASTSADITFGDNDKAIFGAGSDLQIYHTGGQSIIEDSGQGNLVILATDFYLNNSANTENMITALNDGAVNLFYNGSAKLATTSTGIDVTGTVTADGLTVDGDVRLDGGSSGSDRYLRFTEWFGGIQNAGFYLHLDGADDDLYIGRHDTADTNVANDKPVIGIDRGTGDISFYEDTGTTAKFFWDASAESLGIGTSSPAYMLDVIGTGRINGMPFTSSGAVRQIATHSNAGAMRLVGGSDSTASAFIDITGASYNASSPVITFNSNATERLRIDSSGNVGIGTSLPETFLHLSGSSTKYTNITMEQTDTTLATDQPVGQFLFKQNDASGAGTPAKFGAYAEGTSGQVGFRFSTGTGNTSTEAMRIDASGNLLVGATSSTGIGNGTNEGIILSSSQKQIIVGVDSDVALYLNRLTSDGNIQEFRKNGTTVGSIGCASGTLVYYFAGPQNGVKIIGPATGVDAFGPASTSGQNRDNLMDLGWSSNRFDDVYATNGTIQTSDRNEKQDIEALSDAEQRVAVACKGLLRKFRWIDAVAEKGDDARIHFGIIAQDLQDAFAAEGLDAGRYAMFISSTWWETQTEVPAVEAVAEVLDEDGNVVTEAVEAKEAYTRTDTYETLEEAPEGATERTRLGVRYPELLAFIIAAI